MIRKVTSHILVVLILLILNSCGNSKLDNGIWRGVLKTSAGVEIPFNFALSDSSGKKLVQIINGDERFKVEDVVTIDDSIFLKIPLFDSEIRAEVKSGELKGKWIKQLADKSVSMDFTAARKSWRFFETPVKPKYNATGRWGTTFTNTEGKSTFLVGEFQQEGTRLTGTFLSSTGDYRYLEGSVSDDKLFLSCFNGTDAYLFTGTFKNDSTIVEGKNYSGYSSVSNWIAQRDEKATLPDAYSLAILKPGFKTITFAFPDLDGKTVSVSDDKYKGKVVIVQFLGTWCANCMDETAYLAPFYDRYKSRGVEIIGLAYERTTDLLRSKKAVLNLKNRFNINYDLLLTGYTNNSTEVMKSIPMLDNFMAFPTTLVLDKKGNVRKIHTGFSGPGTGEHYRRFIKEFEGSINELLAEK